MTALTILEVCALLVAYLAIGALAAKVLTRLYDFASHYEGDSEWVAWALIWLWPITAPIIFLVSVSALVVEWVRS